MSYAVITYHSALKLLLHSSQADDSALLSSFEVASAKSILSSAEAEVKTDPEIGILEFSS
uniref:Inhibitor I9 domain-containing protein n=1 Tax=Elaeophora elaphi TaxID=1147741 RepID=A0A0R3RUP6_9BILA